MFNKQPSILIGGCLFLNLLLWKNKIHIFKSP